MVTRVRIDAEGQSRDEVEAHLNAAFQLLFQNSVTAHFTFVGSGFTSYPFGPTAVVPRASELVEEVYETDIKQNGAIHWKGRRTLRFMLSTEEKLEKWGFVPGVEGETEEVVDFQPTFVELKSDDAERLAESLKSIIVEKADLGIQMTGDDVDAPQNT